MAKLLKTLLFSFIVIALLVFLLKSNIDFIFNKNNNYENNKTENNLLKIESKYLFPELIEELDSVNKLKIDKNIILEKINNSWRVKTAGGYFADENKINNILLEAVNLKNNDTDKKNIIEIYQTNKVLKFNLDIDNDLQSWIYQPLLALTGTKIQDAMSINSILNWKSKKIVKPKLSLDVDLKYQLAEYDDLYYLKPDISNDPKLKDLNNWIFRISKEDYEKLLNHNQG